MRLDIRFSRLEVEATSLSHRRSKFVISLPSLQFTGGLTGLAARGVRFAGVEGAAEFFAGHLAGGMFAVLEPAECFDAHGGAAGQLHLPWRNYNEEIPTCRY
ncbi:MAG: hypothetical protein ACREHD_27735 [Pirellulales bacterium]